MADRPILFSGPMVRALLAGTKTQTRRTMNPQPELQRNGFYHVHNKHGGLVNVAEEDVGREAVDYLRIAAGDRLYVREHWRCDATLDLRAPRELRKTTRPIWYEAGFYSVTRNGTPLGPHHPADLDGQHIKGRFRQGMHMPRWASRLTLTVTDVRVERLQDISEGDAWTEGCKKGDPADVGNFFPAEEPDPSGIGYRGWDNARDWYADLWDEINGTGAWDANPWVAAYTFTVHRGNIDAPA